jgi:hypothetical protein
MSNEELLVRLDERLNSQSRQLDDIYEQTVSIDSRLRLVERNLESLQSEVNKIPHIETKVDTVVLWKEHIGGSWKATAVISVVLSFVINGIIQFFTRN